MHLSEIWHSKKNDCRLSRTQVFTNSDNVKSVLLLFTKTDSTNFLLIVLVVLFDILSAYITVAVRVIDLISMCFLFIAPSLPKAKTVIRLFLSFLLSLFCNS